MMRPPSVLRPRTIERLATAVYPSFAMMAGMQLDVFTPLKDGPLNAGQIAAALGIDPVKMAPLLYALVAIGLLTVNGDQFANTPEANNFLVRGRPGYIGMRHHAYRRRWQSMLQVAESIRTGTPQGRVDYASMATDERESFYRSLHTETLAAGRELAARQDFSRYHRLVDVGAGSGGLAIGLAEAWPHLLVTIVDLPGTIPVAQRYVDEAGVEDRVRVMAADIVSGPPDLPFGGELSVVGRVEKVEVVGRQLRGRHPRVIQDPADDVDRAARLDGLTHVSQGAARLVGSEDWKHPSEERHVVGPTEGWLADAGFGDFTREHSAEVYGADFAMARKPTRAEAGRSVP